MAGESGNKPEYPELGHEVARARVRQGWSQPELAKRLRWSKGFIGHIEVGKRRPSPEGLHRLADELGVEYERLAIPAGYVDSHDATEPLQVDAVKRTLLAEIGLLPYEAVEWALESGRSYARRLSQRSEGNDAEKQPDADAKGERSKDDEPTEHDADRGGFPRSMPC